jgi:hypothetical protein
VANRYRLTLTETESQDLEVLARKWTASVRTVRRAQALLLAAAGKSCSSIVVELRSMAGLANGALISRLSCASQRGARCGFPRRTKRKRGAVVSLA